MSAIRFILLSTLILLSACGFHLRGSEQLAVAYSPLIIDAEQLSSQQRAQLRQALTQASAMIVEQAPDAFRLQLKLSPLRTRNVARSNVTGVSLVQLTQGLQYSLQDAHGATVIATRNIIQSLEIERDDNNLLVQQQQMDDAQRQLFQRLIESMLAHLSS